MTNNVVLHSEGTYTNTVVKDTEVVTIIQENKVVLPNSASEVVVLDNTRTVVSTEEKFNTPVIGGKQGPQGIPGASTSFVYMIAAHSLGGNRAVSTDATGKLIYSLLTPSSGPIVGVTTGAANIGEVAEVQITGLQQEPSWSWDISLPIFVGLEGILTQSVPNTEVLYLLGYPVLPNRILIDKQTPIILG